MKVGYLLVQNGLVGWKQSRELRTLHASNAALNPLSNLYNRASMDDMVTTVTADTEKRSHNYSVVTPSVAGVSSKTLT